MTLQRASPPGLGSNVNELMYSYISVYIHWLHIYDVAATLIELRWLHLFIILSVKVPGYKINFYVVQRRKLLYLALLSILLYTGVNV